MSISFNDNEFKRFKFRDLKVYSSTEWLAENKKKYRQVFDRYETTYLYAELSFYNKFFDEKIWEVNVKLKCYRADKKKKEICSLDFVRSVSKYDNVVYIREGWGNKKSGSFWKQGVYYWEAYIEGEKVASRYFYIEDAGQKLVNGFNPYLEISSVKLYEGRYDDVNERERTYFTAFSGQDTRYIYVELLLKNKYKSANWHSEIFIKFYNEARELKGQIVRLNRVKTADDLIKITAGWGSNGRGSWRPGNYTVEIVFLDTLIAMVPFVIGDEFLEGIPSIHLPDSNKPMVLLPDETLNQTFEEVMKRLDELIGLEEIKRQVKDHAQYIKFLKLRKEKGFEEREEINVHSVFTGNPGTGKTTVAKMMGAIYKKMGLLTRGHVHEVDRVDLVGEYIGQTAPKVKEAIEKARGGILFIDEAYSLARSNDDSKDFGREVIEILVKEMSNGKGDMAVIVAGYPNEMKYFIESNPGLRSRFKHYFEFKDYLPQELSAIAEFACHAKEVKLSLGAREHIDKLITDAYRDRNKTFGNARFVYDLIEKAKVNLGLRTMQRKNPEKLTQQELETITVKDVSKIGAKKERDLADIPVDQAMLDLALKELNELIGIENIKKQIRELVDIVRFYRDTGKYVVSNFSFHSIFVGNPGTGKTTVARILTKIYKALGVLERGHMVETDRQGLVAGYMGQTAIKTTEKIEEAMGGVLFIDEAYALSNHGGSHGDYGGEAIQTLLKKMEDDRGEFFLFVAGYPGNMDTFLKANPGFSSRFDKTLHFKDYTSTQLLEIAIKMFKDQNFHLTQKASDYLQNYFTDLYNVKNKYFGNARTVRKVVLDAIKNQNVRLSNVPSEDRKNASLNRISYEDVLAVNIEDEKSFAQKDTIGFRKRADSQS